MKTFPKIKKIMVTLVASMMVATGLLAVQTIQPAEKAEAWWWNQKCYSNLTTYRVKNDTCNNGAQHFLEACWGEKIRGKKVGRGYESVAPQCPICVSKYGVHVYK